MWESYIVLGIWATILAHIAIGLFFSKRMDDVIERHLGRSFVRRASFVWNSLEKYFIMNVSSATFIGNNLIATGVVDGDLPAGIVYGSGSYFCDLYPDDPMELLFDNCQFVREGDGVITIRFGIIPKSLKPPPGLEN